MWRTIDVETEPALGRQRSHQGGAFADELADFYVARPQTVGAGIDAGQRQQSLNQDAHLPADAAAVFENTAVFLGRPRLPQGHVQRRQQRCDRRAKLVRNVGRRLFLALERATQPRSSV